MSNIPELDDITESDERKALSLLLETVTYADAKFDSLPSVPSDDDDDELAKHAEHNQKDHGKWAKSLSGAYTSERLASAAQSRPSGASSARDEALLKPASMEDVAEKIESRLAPLSDEQKQTAFSALWYSRELLLNRAANLPPFGEFMSSGLNDEIVPNFSSDGPDRDLSYWTTVLMNEEWASMRGALGLGFITERIEKVMQQKFPELQVSDARNEGSPASPELQDALTPVVDIWVEAQYDATQERLKAQGVGEVRVWRGLYLDREQGQDFSPRKEQLVVSSRAATSWSTDFWTANKFARGFSGTSTADPTRDPVSLMLHDLVPAELVFSIAGGQGGGTTFGSALEQEVVVLNNTSNTADAFWGWDSWNVADQQTLDRVLLTGGTVPLPQELRWEFEEVPFEKADTKKLQTLNLDEYDWNMNWLRQGSATPLSKHGEHEQSTHGNWAKFKQLFEHIKETGGATYDLKSGTFREEGFAVADPDFAAVAEQTQSIEAFQKNGRAMIRDYYRKWSKQLGEENAHFGCWTTGDPPDKVWFDIANVFQNKQTALALARQTNQLAIYDLKAGADIFLEKAESAPALLIPGSLMGNDEIIDMIYEKVMGYVR